MSSRGLSAILLGSWLAACGAKGPPRPPLSKAPEPVRALQMRQSGDSIEIRWEAPTRRVDGGRIEGPLAFEIRARLLERVPEATPPPSRTPRLGDPVSAQERESFARNSIVVARIEEPGSGKQAAARDSRRERQASRNAGEEDRASLTRVLILGGERFPGIRLTAVRLALAVVAVDAKGRRSKTRTVLEIDPVEPLPPPSAVHAEGTANGVRIVWQRPEEPRRALVNVYRRELPAGQPPTHEAQAAEAIQGSRQLLRLRGAPFDGENLLDSSARTGHVYQYEVRLVSSEPGKGLRESPPAVVRVDHADRFPPAPPTLLTAHILRRAEAGAPAVSVAWSPPLDPDLAGFRIYRAGPDGSFALVADVGPGEAVWIDTGVTAGGKYLYKVTAIDGASPPNESEGTAPVEVGIPAQEIGNGGREAVPSEESASNGKPRVGLAGTEFLHP